MQSCCLTGCESYKYISKQKIGYFKFPLHDEKLLQRWLNQIRLPNWIPTDTHQICSTHFHVDDIDYSYQYPVLKKNAVPMIFPLKHFQTISTCRSFIAPVLTTERKLPNIKPRITSKIKLNKSCQEKSGQTPSPVILLYTQPQLNPVCTSQINQSCLANLNMRKIPLKIEKGPNAVNSDDTNSYIVIISDTRKDKKSLQENKVSQNKQPILRIQIDKKISSHSPVQNVSKYVRGSHSQHSFHEEIEVDHVLSKKVVVFKYNSSTKEIKVCKKDKLSSSETNINTTNFEDFLKSNSNTCVNSRMNDILDRPHNINIISKNQNGGDSEIINVISDDRIDSSNSKKQISTMYLLKMNGIEINTSTDPAKLERLREVSNNSDKRKVMIKFNQEDIGNIKKLRKNN